MKTINWALALFAGGLGSSMAVAHETAIAPSRPGILFVQNDPLNEAANPAEQAQRQLADIQRALAVPGEEMKRETGAYLGVGTGAVPMALRKQLGLSPGMGLMVEAVVPDSPAAKAGIQQYDVLQKLDDQILINTQQLAVLVRSHKVGDEVKLTVIHEGKPQTLTVKLIEHELDPLEEEPHEWGPRVTPIMPGPMVPPVPRKFPDRRDGSKSSALSMTWLDNGQAYTLAMNGDGHKTFAQRDNDGNTVFDVPIDTKEQREKLTPEQKDKLKMMESKMPPEARKIFEEGSQKPTTQPSEEKK